MAEIKEGIFTLTPISFNSTEAHIVGRTIQPNDCSDKLDPLAYCRTCATADPCLVPIFKGEGLNYQLSQKIQRYLPIQISQDDDLPVQLCYHCASTLVAWDTLIVGCVQAEKKLKSLQNSLGNESCAQVKEEVSDTECGLGSEGAADSDDEPLITKKFAIRKATKRKGKRQREILQEKTDPQKLSQTDAVTENKRLTGEQDLSFTAYQRHFGVRNPLITELFQSGKDNAFKCKMCAAFRTIKSLSPDTAECCMCSPFKGVDAEFGCERPDVDDSHSRDTLINDDARIKVKKLSTIASQVVCEDCGKTLSSKISLNNHKKIHTNEKTMTCHVCGTGFRHRFNLVRHLRVIHEGVREHVCSDCGKKYRSQGELLDHRNIHDSRSKIVCEDCGRTFLTKASFYTHKKGHKTKKTAKDAVRFTCTECEKTFTTKKSRNQHLLIHSGEKPIDCSFCEKRFRTRANLSQHIKVHSDLKPFACEHCGKRFGRKDHLTIHVRCHTGEKPFTCKYCGRGFAQMNDMKKHSKIHEKLYG